MPLVTLMLVVSLGLIGLAYDFGTQFLLLAELQKAADAAAIAGASQLDLTEDQDVVAVRVLEAVDGAAITANESRLADLPGTIAIASTRILQSIPDNDDDPIGAEHEGSPYAYVEVTTAVASTSFTFLQLFGAEAINTTATAVAGRQSVNCMTTAIAVCNPFETRSDVGAAFDPGDYIGHQIMGNSRISGNSMVPGKINWVVPPGVGQGASELAHALATVGGTGTCSGGTTGVDLRQGTVASLRTALNTRFDLYENPHFGGSSNDDDYPPAENVTKGYSSHGDCNNDPSDAPNIMALPRDSDISEDNRVGNGEWDCAAYWLVNHPSRPAPTGCSAAATNTLMRFEVYQYEIANNMIPNNLATAGENGNPMCSLSEPVESNTSDPDQFQFDRRVVTIAVLNCMEHGLSQNDDDVPVEWYMAGFLTEPTINEHANNVTLYVEIIGSNVSGQTGYAPVSTMNSVEIVR